MINQKHEKIDIFIILKLAFIMLILALPLDMILPATHSIKDSLNIIDNNEFSYIINIYFAGTGIGYSIYGPIADRFGRKPALYIGITIFTLGCVISFFAQNLEVMLIGRFVQGFGAAVCRVITMTVITDIFHKKIMGKAMSFLITIFVFAPAVGPMIGKLILSINNQWQSLFIFFVIIGIIGILIIKIGLNESLNPQYKLKLNIRNLVGNAKEILTHRHTMIYSIVFSLIFGSFIGYLNIIRPILVDKYNLEINFPIYFAILTSFIAISNLINALFLKMEIKKMTIISLSLAIFISLVTSIIYYKYPEIYNLYFLLGYIALVFLIVGSLFGNLNTLAMMPMSHIAGTASGMISTIQTILSLLIGMIISHLFKGSEITLILSIFVISLISLILITQFCKDKIPQQITKQ